MKNLVDLYLKVLDADHKVSQAMESDWASSTRAYKAAATRASKAYSKAIEDYLGAEWTTQDKINLMTAVQREA